MEAPSKPAPAEPRGSTARAALERRRKPLALPCPCLQLPMDVHRTSTCTQELLGAPLELFHSQSLWKHRGPVGCPCCPTRSHHPICTGLLVLPKEAMPEVRKLSSVPALPAFANHQQEQSSVHPRGTRPQPPEALGYCHCYPHPTWFKTAPAWGSDGPVLASSPGTPDLGLLIWDS